MEEMPTVLRMSAFPWLEFGTDHALNISSFLLLATIASYIPQIRRIALRKDCCNISAVSFWLNHILATEQFALGILILVEYENVSDSPPPLLAWLDFLQFAVVWAGNGVLSVDFSFSKAYSIKTDHR